MLHVDLTVSSSGDVVLAMAGEVGPAAAGLLAESLDRARAAVAGSGAIVVDLTGIRLLDDAGVAVLLAFGRECDRRGVPLRVVSEHPAPAGHPAPADHSALVDHDAAPVPDTVAVPAARRPEEVDHRAVVGQALGILMADLGLDEERARARLTELARRSGLDEVAASIEVVSRTAARPTAATPSKASATRTAPRPLEIDFVAASWEAESTEYRTHIADLAAALSRSGHAVTLHIRRDSPELPDVARTRRGYRLVRVPAGPPFPLSQEALLSCLDGFAAWLDHRWVDHVPDVVHLHSWMSGLAVRECDAPLVQSFHGLKVAERHGLHAVEREIGRGVGGRANLELLMALAADHVITASGDEKRGLVRSGVPATSVSLVPWGVDTDRFSPEGPRAVRGPLRRVVALGELVPHSGFRAVVEAVAGVPDAELLFVGPFRSPFRYETPELRGLARHARDHGVADRTRFLGRVERQDLPALLRSSDIAVHVPRHEPSGIAALRAMACGVPVIASAVDALADIVVDGLTGSLVPPRAPVALGRALRRLLGDPTRRGIYSATGVDRVRSRYSWNRVAADVADTYHLAVGTARRRSRTETPRGRGQL
ncbi:glycosyltransferase [Umezawaea sp.]|uniref:glycosyltransferase n=1 Tax=Umezawaea sp. TaxID=1955258 RepID=UPI002ED33D5C